MGGLARIDFDPDACARRLEETPEVLTEAIQTVLRTLVTDGDPYDVLRRLSRGRSLTLSDLHVWLDELEIPEDVKARLAALRPAEYTGIAAKICRTIVRAADTWIESASSSAGD